MTKTTAKEYLPLVQALAEGKTIQMRGDNDQEWEDSSKPDWTLHPHLYRIKPEPRRWFLWWDCFGVGHVCDAKPSSPFIEVVEVIK